MKRKFETYKNLALISQIGITMTVHIVLGMMIGVFLDSFFKTKPFIMMAMIIIFVFAGFFSIYKLSISTTKYDGSKIDRRK